MDLMAVRVQDFGDWRRVFRVSVAGVVFVVPR